MFLVATELVTCFIQWNHKEELYLWRLKWIHVIEYRPVLHDLEELTKQSDIS